MLTISIFPKLIQNLMIKNKGITWKQGKLILKHHIEK